jgi:hypothetical protein
MFKMKSALYIVAIFSLALVSCIQQLPEKPMPDVDNGAITMIKATVEPLELEGVEGVGIYKWNEQHTLGIYGTSAGANECYLPVKSTTGDNEAYFYGNVVGGDLTIYMPYVEEGSETALSGRVVVSATQQYYADAFDHLMYNSTLLATATSDEVSFAHYAGLVKIELKYDIQDITAISVQVGNVTLGGDYDDNFVGDLSVDPDAEKLLVNGTNRLSIVNFPEGSDSSVEAPMVVWAAMAPGVYENLVVEISNAEMTIAAPVKGPFEVNRCAVCEQVCVAEKVDHNNSMDDFQGENGEFNPKN